MKIVLKNVFGLTLIILALVISLAGCKSVPNIEWEFKITGAVTAPNTLTFEELTELEQVSLNDVFMSKTYGEDEFRSFSGIPIENLFERAGANKDMVSITALAADGYAIEIPLADLEGGILALKDGGEWIIDKEPESGPLRLVFPKTP
ncbi:MAG: molybdopterin-dependent oxidoreductase, partial [Anaerolineaceae bacterium]|nr:molybdopterin-dependent oxidoreductase [Anaerolineaceae bacterium]